MNFLAKLKDGRSLFRPVGMSALLLALAASPALAVNPLLTDFTSATYNTTIGAADGTAAGVLDFGSGTANVTYTGSVSSLLWPANPAANPNSNFNDLGIPGFGTSFSFEGGGFDVEIFGVDAIANNGSGAVETHTYTFDTPLTDPVLFIDSLGGTSGLTESWTFDQPFSIFSGENLVQQPGNVLAGTEGNGIIQFSGPVSQISWQTSVFEATTRINVGVLANPALTTTPSASDVLNFGNVLVGTTGTETITATNTGDPLSRLDGAFNETTGPGEFAGVPSNFNFGPLGQGESASRDYEFTPTSRGTQNGFVSVTSNANDMDLNLLGNGVAPVLGDFGSPSGVIARVGDSANFSFDIQNSGDGNTSGQGTISNLNGSLTPGSGAISGGGNFSIPDNTTASIGYTFSPTARGTATEQVVASFTNGNPNGTNSPVGLAAIYFVEAVGPEFDTDLPDTSSTIDFGEIMPDETSFFTLQIINNSFDNDLDELTDLSILGITFGGGDADKFEVINFTNPVVLALGETFDLELSFKPQSMSGLFATTISIETDQLAAFGSDGLDFQFDLQGLSTIPVPEPSSLVLAGTALLGGCMLIRRRRRT